MMTGIYENPVRGIPGYPNAPEDWNENEAVKIALIEGIELGPDHWDLLRALQEYFSKQSTPETNTRDLHDALDEKFHLKGGMRYLYVLLPKGPVAQGCRFAGLPVPAGAIDRSFGSVK